ncbi:MAG TPA: hypothetical protein VNH53_07355 [Sphingomicrobium sp.]|nr:hypothetical protein [Sphingomicrobium sp.]
MATETCAPVSITIVTGIESALARVTTRRPLRRFASMTMASRSSSETRFADGTMAI